MKEVIIYSTPTCHYCNLAKEFFKGHNVSYTEHNVGTDIEKRREMMELTGQLGVPVIRVGEDVLVGFQPSRLEEMLGIA